MPPAKVIRIDEEVWAELQKRARPLVDTPNSVLRRVFSLSEEGSETDETDIRITKLLKAVDESVGNPPKCAAAGKTIPFCLRLKKWLLPFDPESKGSELKFARKLR